MILEKYNDHRNEPFLESTQNVNLTVMENESVVLKCGVKNKGNKTVSPVKIDESV